MSCFLRIKMRYSIFLILVIGVLLISGCGSRDTPLPAELSQTPCSTAHVAPTVTQPVATDTVAAESDGSSPFGLGALVPTLADIAPTRTPVPTATPSVLVENLAELIQDAGLSQKTLLRLQYADWINLGISLLYVVIGYLAGTWVIRWLLPRLARRTKTKLDEQLLQVSGSEVRWLVVVIILRMATNRLTFVHADTKTLLNDIYFSLIVLLAVLILWRLIRLAAQQALDGAVRRGQRKQSESLITLSVWALRLTAIIVAISLALTHFGVNITGFAIFLGIIGVVLSLAGQDIVSDIISGALILIDRPYRIGDRIELPAIDSLGDVIDIGMRSTRILTLNNRMVVVPNSRVGKDQIVNHSYPDPSYYDQVDVVVAYDNDVDRVGQLLVNTVRSVEGVEKEREIDALLNDLTENHLVFRVGWWITSYEDSFVVRDRVTRSVIQALKDAGVILPYARGSVRVEMNPGEA